MCGCVCRWGVSVCMTGQTCLITGLTNRFYMSLVSLLGSKPKAVYGATAEVVGMVMAQMEKSNDVRMYCVYCHGYV